MPNQTIFQTSRFPDCLPNKISEDNVMSFVEDLGNPLKRFHAAFAKAPGQVYLAGNSLGLMPLEAENKVSKLLQEWKTHAIEGWTNCD